MYISNLLANVSSTVTSYGSGAFGSFTAKYAWICDIISKIIGFAGDVGLGIILFTVILKLITLAPDIISRVSMKKNALKMEAMKDDLEKLQKQYAKNKDLYQQKMMALYKKNGYSAFSACLPTIITLVFFFIVIAAFNSYSQISERQVFVDMGTAYDTAINEFTDGDDAVLKKIEDNTYSLVFENVIKEKGFEDCFIYENGEFLVKREKVSSLISVYPSIADFINESGVVESREEVISLLYASLEDEIITSNFEESEITSLLNQGLIFEDTLYGVKFKTFKKVGGKVDLLQKSEYSVLKARYCLEDGTLNYAGIKNDSSLSGYLEKYEKSAENFATEKILVDFVGEDYKKTVIYEKARRASAEAYENNNAKSVIFPWVKNIWSPDCAWTSVIPSHSDLVSKLGGQKNPENLGVLINESVYNELTYYLGQYKQSGFSFKYGNGWFILVALSILTMLLSTVISQKTQKTQMQLSTVEGDASTAASTQKMMTWMMPIMFGIFAFIYSAAFSIYMVTNSLLSTASTVLINKIVELKFNKKIEKEEKDKNDRPRYGKIR